jgi:hypothetical protein
VILPLKIEPFILSLYLSKMYAFIVNNAWSNYGSKDIAGILRDVGTPSLKMNINDSLTAFNDVSGFYVKIETDWAVRFKSELVTNDGLSSSMASLSVY